MTDAHFWPWWLGALGLAGTAVGFRLLLGRAFGVSSICAAVLTPSEPVGGDDVGDVAAIAANAGRPVVTGVLPLAPSLGRASQWLFIICIGVGGMLGALQAGTLGEGDLGATFSRLIGEGPAGYVALLLGGVLVGFGTQMAGGCTSGHGLVGTARLQPASILSTATFFGVGIGVSFVLAWAAS